MAAGREVLFEDGALGLLVGVLPVLELGGLLT